MIYLQKGLKNSHLTKQSTEFSDWDWFKSYQPLERTGIDSSDLAHSYKENEAAFVLAGKMATLTRNDTNLIKRSILFFDIDGTDGDDYQTAVSSIQSALAKIVYLVYPTVSNGYKGTRLRLAVPIDSTFDAMQRIQLGNYLRQLLPNNWQTDLTSYGSHWSQLAGLPVLNAYSMAHNCKLAMNDTKSFLSLAQIKSSQAPMIKPQPQELKGLAESKVRNNRQPWQDSVNQALTKLVTPPGHGRHDFYSSLIGSFLFMQIDQHVIETLLLWSNEHSDNPLPESELYRTIDSVSRTAARKERVNG
ncbi:primase C-terminal domain-containing protein [Oenococcus oeni]|uniref:Primase C-terminal 1 domain-containing protein n=1 Tax=Oenococcus oeni TaxID=1247 RepID=A0A6N4A7U5_OENOE|nr:primase C-terminal domain-containing protein [Oenococcus oeni]EKP89526.1 putative phage protein [Oenococcus oeni DSM 20252 = AWRIB129]KGH53516.1 hypothetical protein X299_06130 [Oenococcus oeni IOEB_S277]KGH59366.1 hypothetical protein X288_04320 [Oenococcus oeni IOEB_9805]KGH74999.1 hypothetical protein X287_07800 [Oenococcus oeni IOEB_9803]KGH77736.1 hypothetical protein X285_04285 [Oenococcus oeni IOEB_9304]